MTAKKRIEELRDALRRGDVEVCGESPRWVQEELLKRIDGILEDASESMSEATANSFFLGAIRFIADSCGSECDQLVDSLSQLMG